LLTPLVEDEDDIERHKGLLIDPKRGGKKKTQGAVERIGGS
jgi:putative ubiquitin-RnfH superfamily antitoxin RatB of RatAB toxin-antitoxin module